MSFKQLKPASERLRKVGGESGASSTSQLSRSLVGHFEEACPGDVTKVRAGAKVHKSQKWDWVPQVPWGLVGLQGPSSRPELQVVSVCVLVSSL